MSDRLKMFVSEEEVEAKRQQRQEEWEKVRKPDDPLECPEEETRSLFEQLQANKEGKERELEDENRLRSSVKGLDSDEVQFLNFVSNRQMQVEKERSAEEQAVLEQMKVASVVKVQEKTTSGSAGASTSSSNSQPAPTTAANKSTQRQKLLLQGAIKRKSTDSASGEESQSQSQEGADEPPAKVRPDAALMAGIPNNNNSTMVVAGVLPGITEYSDSDSSTENDSNSSDSEADHMILPSAPTQRILQELVQKLKEQGQGCS